MKNVTIRVTGVQQDAQNEESRIELIALGRYYQKNNTEYITYDETQISGLEGTTTLLKILGEEVVLARMGNVQQRMTFRRGEKHFSLYITPYGKMEMGIFTKELLVEQRGLAPSLRIVYDLEIDGRWQSRNTLSIQIREEPQNGH